MCVRGGGVGDNRRRPHKRERQRQRQKGRRERDRQIYIYREGIVRERNALSCHYRARKRETKKKKGKIGMKS